MNFAYPYQILTMTQFNWRIFFNQQVKHFTSPIFLQKNIFFTMKNENILLVLKLKHFKICYFFMPNKKNRYVY